MAVAFRTSRHESASTLLSRAASTSSTPRTSTGGASESFLGEVLSKRPRDSYILGTKLRFPVGDGTGEGLSAEQVHKQIDLSLRRLQTDYVDLYQCHRDDPDTPLEETMEALTDVVRMGKVRYIGFSEFPPELIQRSLDLTRERGFENSFRHSRSTRCSGGLRRTK
jgi:aryl-alcohol dehydrogenase-like predicted oxidoreductase